MQQDQSQSQSHQTSTKIYTCAEVAKHNKPDDCWVIFEDKVLDLTNWLPKHPGGHSAIMQVAGIDATDEILGMHSEEVCRRVNAFVIGRVSDVVVPTHVKEFRELIKKVTRDPKWMTTDYWYYYKRIPFLFGLLVTSISLYLLSSSLTCHVLAGILLGLYWQQAALVGHDAGHSSITHKTDIDVMIIGWLVGTVSNGFSINWWRSNHNTHHLATNSVEHDPDIQHLPFIAITEMYFNNLYSTYYNHVMHFGALAKVLVMFQHILFLPSMALARVFLHVQSLSLLLNFSKKVPARGFELLGMVLYFTWMYCLVCIAGPAYGRNSSSRWAFLASSHAFAGILHIQITLNHMASPVHSDSNVMGARGGKDFLTAQLNGTCDIACSEAMDWFHGGLQFQVEHHLCPRMPRHNLRAFVPHIRELALKHGLPYEARSFLSALMYVHEKLYHVAMLARKRVLADWPQLEKALNLIADSDSLFNDMPFYS